VPTGNWNSRAGNRILMRIFSSLQANGPTLLGRGNRAEQREAQIGSEEAPRERPKSIWRVAWNTRKQPAGRDCLRETTSERLSTVLQAATRCRQSADNC